MGGDDQRVKTHAAETALFAHLVNRPDDALDLAQCALLVAAPEYPGLDFEHYIKLLDQLAERARPRLRGRSGVGDRAQALVGYLVHEEGFHGNVEHYGDPRNSFLNEVLDRRLGIPISLAVVMLEVGRRLHVPLAGVSFPGHFLVAAFGDTLEEEEDEAEELEDGEEEEGEALTAVYFDPFTAHALSVQDLRDLRRRTTGEGRRPLSEELQPVSNRAILTRMLANLKGIYQQQRDEARLALVEERLRLLNQRVPPRARLVH